MERTLISETVKKIGQVVRLCGWVERRRDHGKLVFIDLKDRSGIVQIVGHSGLGDLHIADVLEIEGSVEKRPTAMVNKRIPTGKIEIKIEKMKILAKSAELPLDYHSDGYDINEEVRLKYRYLDLRRPRLQRNIRLRSKFVELVRQYLFSKDFVEIETPILTKATPEGARDFIVPSRLQPGEFYALPQSPQQYKQLLMVAGFERYFQIARCLRDEDLRADRGFEHTQIDIEMSFVEREEVMALDEGMITNIIEKMGYPIKEKPFPVFTYQKAMGKFKSDKFDFRSEKEKKERILAFAWVIDFPFFKKTAEGDWTFTHNPFSAPKPEHKKWLLDKDHIGEIITSQYDLVCNGYEVGGGSIRSHEPEVLKTVFEIMGLKEEEIIAKFGHMLQAFRYGVPPHGGLAHGIERLLMTMTGELYLREVVAFPMTAGGQTAVMEAPSVVENIKLRELGIKVVGQPQVSRSDTGQRLYEMIINLLKENKIDFEPYGHEPVYTSEQAAKVRGTKIEQGAKALVMMADRKPVMLVISAAKKIDTKKFKKTFGIKDLRMATAEEVKTLTGTEIGAVPPFGNLVNLSTYVDESLGKNEEITFNAGLHTRSVKMKYQDWLDLVKPQVGNFSQD